MEVFYHSITGLGNISSTNAGAELRPTPFLLLKFLSLSSLLPPWVIPNYDSIFSEFKDLDLDSNGFGVNSVSGLSDSVLFPLENLETRSKESRLYEKTAKVSATYNGPCLIFNAPSFSHAVKESQYSKAFEKVRHEHFSV